MVLAQIIPFGVLKVMFDHFRHQFIKGYFRGPAKFLLGLGRIAQKGLYLCGAEVLGIYFNNGLAGLCVNALFIHAPALPGDVNAHCSGGDINKLPHRVLNTRSNDKILGLECGV